MAIETRENKRISPTIQREQEFRKKVLELEKSDRTHGNDMVIFDKKFQLILEFTKKEREILLKNSEENKNELIKNYGSQIYSPQRKRRLDLLVESENTIPEIERATASGLISEEKEKTCKRRPWTWESATQILTLKREQTNLENQDRADVNKLNTPALIDSEMERLKNLTLYSREQGLLEEKEVTKEKAEAYKGQQNSLKNILYAYYDFPESKERILEISKLGKGGEKYFYKVLELIFDTRAGGLVSERVLLSKPIKDWTSEDIDRVEIYKTSNKAAEQFLILNLVSGYVELKSRKLGHALRKLSSIK